MSLRIFMFKIMRVMGLFFLASHMTIVFLFSGLFFNLLQFILYKLLYNVNRRIYRKLNYFLIYWSWTQILNIYEWRSNSSCNMYGDPEHMDKFGKEHCLIVMNHKYDIDWVICWFIANNLRMLANAKACSKKSLRNIPVIGWGWIFGEMIFLERNWEKDKLTLGDKLDKLASYEDPIMLLYFCEGTRFTPEKHKASMEFAKARNLPQLQHHLCPRTSGFNFTAKHLKGKVPVIYNVQLGFPETEHKPTFANLLRGHSYTADLFVERIPMEEVPTDSDEATSKWLYELYQRKDKLMDDYFKTGKFPGECRKITRSYRTLANSIFWAIFIGVPWAYLLYAVLTTGNMFLVSIVTTVFVMLFTVMYYMVRATKADKGSTYGTNKKSQAPATNGSHKENKAENDERPTETTQENGVKTIEGKIIQDPEPTNNNL